MISQTTNQNNNSQPTTTDINKESYRLPSHNTLQHAASLSIVEDKPVMFDYWRGSLDKTILIGIKENKEKLLVKSESEYTSPISNILKSTTEYIVVTENSIYIVDINIPIKRISS